MKEKKRTYSLIIAVLILLVALEFVTILLRSTDTTLKNSYNTGNLIVSDNETNSDVFSWDYYYQLNDDFVGLLKFNSGLIELPIVQGESNDTYLRKNFKTKDYDEIGTPFLDVNNNLTDQNLIIYGHYVYPEIDDTGTLAFTPLSQLLTEEGYKKNKTVKLYLKDEIRTYEIVAVYYCPVNEDEEIADDGLLYYWTNFDEDYFEVYKENVLANALYDTGVDFSFEDSFLTLQTCVENHNELREIVLLKEIKSNTCSTSESSC